jgi:hypothetical protein
MALITSPTETIPDLNYEYHTVTIDSIGQDSANTFTCYLQQPLKNVVQARLLGARISTTTATEHCYISIDELDSIFNDRASNVYEGQASMSVLRSSFASIVTDGAADIVFKDNYTIATQYIDPIRRIDRLTITIRDQDAVTVPDGTGNNFLVIRFVCRKPNL